VTARKIFRASARVVAIVAILAFATMVALQYARILHRNIVLAHALWSVQADVARLDAERVRGDAKIKRLEDPRGAIPEIHDRLHLTMPNEAIIYLRPAP
jgi:cell division protein FtsB